MPSRSGRCMPKPIAARLLAAHHRAGLDHLGADVLEAHRRLVDLHAVALAEPADHRGLVDVVTTGLAQAAMLQQVVHEQAHHLQLVDERALLVGRTRAVRVTVEQQAQVVAAAGQDAERLVDVRPDRLRVDAAEERVALRVDLVDLDLAAAQEARDPARARPPHRLHQDAHVGCLSQAFELERPLDVALVAVERVEELDPACRQRPRRRAGARASRSRRSAADRALERRQDLRSGRGPGLRLDLEPVVGPRVMGGGDDDAARGAALHDLVRDHLGRHGAARESDGDVGGEQDLGRGLGEELAREAPVVADHDARAPLAPSRRTYCATPSAQRRTFSYV